MVITYAIEEISEAMLRKVEKKGKMLRFLVKRTQI